CPPTRPPTFETRHPGAPGAPRATLPTSPSPTGCPRSTASTALRSFPETPDRWPETPHRTPDPPTPATRTTRRPLPRRHNELGPPSPWLAAALLPRTRQHLLRGARLP